MIVVVAAGGVVGVVGVAAVGAAPPPPQPSINDSASVIPRRMMLFMFISLTFVLIKHKGNYMNCAKPI
jgi:hypothetical protein